MAEIELYRQVFTMFKELCASGKQPSSFDAFCAAHGVRQRRMRSVLKDEFQPIRTLPGYSFSTGPCAVLNPNELEVGGAIPSKRTPTPKSKQGVSFEEVIFEEAGFMPIPKVEKITVRVDRDVEVTFPPSMDIDAIALFVNKVRREVRHVES